MPTILIADDNSNIQKMVALAFKGEGIDVVAVGNGEAAVRKAPDLMPDLVLADIFMPVRNGYEVCEFIKQNTKLSHVPVILLAGAFDPFDEKEAQRVGADGVLKKPFVPPDPLVNLVKELLARSQAEHLVPVSVAAVAPQNNSIAAPATASEPVAPREVSPAPTAFDLPAEALPTSTGPEELRPFKDFVFQEEPGHSASDGGSSAFASLMDSGLGHRVEFPEENITSPISAESETSEENEIEEAPAKEFSGFSSWLSKTPELDSAASALETPGDGTPSPVDSTTEGILARPWGVPRAIETRPEEETIVEPLDRFAATHLPGQVPDDFPVYRVSSHHEPAQTIKPAEILSEAPAEAEPDASDWVDMGAGHEASAESAGLTREADDASNSDAHTDAPEDSRAGTQLHSHEEPAPTFHTPFSIDDTQTIDAIRSSAMPWHSVPSAFREPREEYGKPSGEHEGEYLPQHFAAQYSPSKHDDSSATDAENTTLAESNASGSPDTVDATDYEAPIYEAMGAERESLDSPPAVETLPAVIHASAVQSLPTLTPATLDARQIEDIVSRVVERMQPQVLDVITKEILRPVVEALVRKQLEQK